MKITSESDLKTCRFAGWGLHVAALAEIAASERTCSSALFVSSTVSGSCVDQNNSNHNTGEDRSVAAVKTLSVVCV